MTRPRHPILRLLMLIAGALLMVTAPIVAPLPGPAATFMFVAGLILVLRNSYRARVRFARVKRRWPKAGALTDRIMRRPSALRRRERDQALPPR